MIIIIIITIIECYVLTIFDKDAFAVSILSLTWLVGWFIACLLISFVLPAPVLTLLLLLLSHITLVQLVRLEYLVYSTARLLRLNRIKSDPPPTSNLTDLFYAKEASW